MPPTTVAKYLAFTLPEFGVSHVFELAGGMVTVMLDALHAEASLTVISMHHEQGAGFAAEGFTRVAGVPAVALATSGPGATNLLTAIGSCYFDSIPAVFITGQVNRHELGHGHVGRQGGFQELDIVAMATPITKLATTVMDAEAFPQVLADAFRQASSGRPGPVLIDLPMDVQQSAIVPSMPRRPIESPRSPSKRLRFLLELQAALSESKRPLVLVGGGVRSARSTDLLGQLIQVCPLPVVTSLMGLDAVPSTDPCRAGLIGSYGNRWANALVTEADLLLVLGSRLDIRQTGSDISGFRSGRKLFHVDIDVSELNGRVGGCNTLNDDLAEFLRAAITSASDWQQPSDAWLWRVDELRAIWPDIQENQPHHGINPNLAVREICSLWPTAATFVTDVGQHQMWAAQSVQLTAGQRFLTSGGMGSMGFGLPAAIGAALANPRSPVCLIAGDGGLQCNIQELQTVVRLNLPIRVVVFDNECLGMVRQFQESHFGGRYHSTTWGYSAPNFAALASAYGISVHTVNTHEQLRDALIATATDTTPVLIHVMIEQGLNVYPKMAFGQPYGSMEPLVQPLRMEGT